MVTTVLKCTKRKDRIIGCFEQRETDINKTYKNKLEQSCVCVCTLPDHRMLHPTSVLIAALLVDSGWPFQPFKVRKRVGVVLCVHKCIGGNWHWLVEYILVDTLIVRSNQFN